MALGKHWEWRGFGKASSHLRALIMHLPPLLDQPWQVTDHYLWVPGCPTNVKLREGDLKLKRFVEREGDLECWMEDEAEAFTFPLDQPVVLNAASALGVVLPCLPHGAVGREAFLALLRETDPPVQVVTVEKVRWLRQLKVPGEAPVVVELAEILAPEAVVSVGLEHYRPTAVRQTKAYLGLDREDLRPLNYLQALAAWVEGGTMT